MKKKIYNIFGLRCLMMAVLAAVCGTSWADGVSCSPLAPWWDSNSSGYVLRTIDDDHTVLAAFQALQEINTSGNWGDYSGCTFYLAEDVDLSSITNWEPLGTSTNPFKSNFYCYAPSYNCYSSPTNAVMTYVKKDAKEVWADGYKFTFKNSDFDDVDAIISNNLSNYIVEKGSDTFSFYATGSEYLGLSSEEEYVFEGKTPTVEGHKYVYNVDDIYYDTDNYDDLEAFLSATLINIYYQVSESTVTVYATEDEYDSNFLSSYFVKKLTPTVAEVNKYVYTAEDINYDTESYDDLAAFLSTTLDGISYQISDDESTVTIYATEEEYEGFSSYFVKELTPSKEGSTTIYYPVLPSCSVNLGYYCTEHSDDGAGTEESKVYYSSDGHVGTCKIKNMTVDGSYADGAGFFGYIYASLNDVCLGGFTFENCSVTNEATGGFAGTLYGIGNNGSYTITVKDLFIGSNSARCNVKAGNAGGVYGENTGQDEGEDEKVTIFDVTDTSEKEFDRDLTITTNFAYINFPAGTGVHKKVSATADEAENLTVDATAATTINYAFGTSDGTESGTRGKGSDEAPFYLSTPEHIQNMIDIIANPSKISTFIDLKDLNISSIAGMNFKQVGDITVSSDLTSGIGVYSDTGDDRKPFTGTYDGNGKTIEVNIKGTQYCALFECTDGATIKDLDIEGTNTATGFGAAGIIGYDVATSKGSTISGCVANVTVSASNNSAFGLVACCNSSDNLPTITDSYNKAAKDLGFCNLSSNCATSKKVTWNVDGETLYGEGTQNYPLQISSFDKLNNFFTNNSEIANLGLYYQLTNNLIDVDTKLVNPNGTNNLPSNASNKSAYIDEFCGHIDGYGYDENASGEISHIIVGLTNKALFGTITGPTEIKNIGFVNCYNKDNTKVNLANEIGKDEEEQSYTLSIDHCYSDGSLDFGGDATKKLVYQYNDEGKIEYYNADGEKMSKTPSEGDGWVEDGTSNRMILSANSFTITDTKNPSTSYTTDAVCCKVPKDNTEFYVTDDARGKYKYNVEYNNNGSYSMDYLYLRDVMDFYDPDDTKTYGMTLDKIKSMDFTGLPNNVSTVKYAYYCRKAHNDWESVTLPFAYSRSNIQESGKFMPFTYIDYRSEEAVFTNTYTTSEYAAGQPMLFRTDGTTDFVVVVSNSDGIELSTEATPDNLYRKTRMETKKLYQAKISLVPFSPLV